MLKSPNKINQNIKSGNFDSPSYNKPTSENSAVIMPQNLCPDKKKTEVLLNTTSNSQKKNFFAGTHIF